MRKNVEKPRRGDNDSLNSILLNAPGGFPYHQQRRRTSASVHLMLQCLLRPPIAIGDGRASEWQRTPSGASSRQC